RLNSLLQETRVKRSDPAYAAVSSSLGVDLGDSFTLAQLGKRADVNLETIRSLLPFEYRSAGNKDELESALADSLYAGYIQVQQAARDRLHQHDSLQIPRGFNFREMG